MKELKFDMQNLYAPYHFPSPPPNAIAAESSPNPTQPYSVLCMTDPDDDDDTQEKQNTTKKTSLFLMLVYIYIVFVWLDHFRKNRCPLRSHAALKHRKPQVFGHPLITLPQTLLMIETTQESL